MKKYQFRAESLHDTDRLGAALAEVLPGGAVVGLRGTLGAGKTRLVQALAKASGVPDRTVTSPTFVLIQQYQAELPLYHFDAYRLRDEDEFRELGAQEYLEGQGITLIEWADRVETCLPDARLDIEIEVTGESTRTFTLQGPTGEYADLVERVRALTE